MRRFGEKLRRLRKQRRMTIVELAEVLGYAAHSHVSEIENGKREPSLKFAVKAAQLFNVTTDHLLNDSVELPIDVAEDSNSEM